MTRVIDFLPRAELRRETADLTDGQLLDGFLSRRDEAAFGTLVRRHASMVWGVCRRIVHNHHDAEDAFQATYLVLARKAASIAPREMVANWLYGVAYRTAVKARMMAAKRKARERQVMHVPEPPVVDADLWRDLQPVLDQELSRLPEKYRVTLLLCDLEGKSRKEAARQLAIPEGTLSSRLTTARTKLARRLTRRGVALSSAALAVPLAQNAATASVPAAVVSSTIKAAIPFAAGQAAAGLLSPSVAALTEGVLDTMSLAKLKTAAAVVLAVAILGAGAGVVSLRSMAAPPDSTLADGSSGAGTERRAEAARPEERGRAGDERSRDPRPAPAFSGKITAISADGKTVTLEYGARGVPAQKVEVKLTDKTRVEFAGVLKELNLKLKEGDSAAVWLQEGSKDTAAAIQASRNADLTGKIVAVSGDEKKLTVEVPGRTRGAGPEKLEIKITEETKTLFGRGRGEPEEKKLLNDYLASVWLREGSKDTAAALQVVRPNPQVVGKVTAISGDGKVLTVETRGRGGEGHTTEVKLAPTTKLEFVGGENKDNKIKVGNGVAVWLQEGSRDTAATVQANLARRTPDVQATIAAISADGKTLTLEIRKRGEETSTKIDIKLTDKTEIEFAGIDRAEEKKLTVGYNAAVWLQDGSKDTAAVVVATKPVDRGR
jgi:RNA polymerase sigma factor (sigma-70 family)